MQALAQYTSTKFHCLAAEKRARIRNYNATGKLRMLKPVIDELDNKFTTKETRHVQMIYTKHDYTVPEVLQY